MPSITYKTFLMRETAPDVYQKVIDIKDYPDLGGTREAKDVTTLSDGAFVYVPGLKSGDPMEFTSNYKFADFASLKALEADEHKFAVWMGGLESGSTVTPTGSDGKFEFTGYITTFPPGAGVDDVREMKSTILLSSDVVETGFASLIVTQVTDIVGGKAKFEIEGYPDTLPPYWTAYYAPNVGLTLVEVGTIFDELPSRSAFNEYEQDEEYSVESADTFGVVYVDTEDIIRAVGQVTVKNTI